MAMTGDTAYILSKSYVDETLKGEGALKGKDGESAYQIALNNGFIGNQKDWLESLKGEKGDDGLNGRDGSNGFSPIITPDSDNTNKVYKLDITTASGSFITDNLKGEQGLQGIQGIQGNEGPKGQQGIQGIKGDKGDDGYPFLIYKEYETIEDFKAADFPEIGLMFMIKTQDETNSFPIYRYTGEESMPYSYITSLSTGEAIKGDKGDKGDKGEQGIAGIDGKDGTTFVPTIGTVTSGETASASVVINKDNKEAEFNFVLPKGEKGNTGKQGEQGEQGIPGKTYVPAIGAVQSGNEAQASVDIDESELKAKFNFTLPKGDKGEQGRSIKSIATDENNNLIVTFDDGEEQNIGQLSIDIQGDFLTSDGFGNLRYYNGKLQYWNIDLEEWIDTSVTPDNIYILNLTPQPMEFISGMYDTSLNRCKLKWKEPDDTILDGQAVCIVESVMIRRKLNESILDENDGELVTIINRSQFGKYRNEWFVDYDGGGISENNTYYYKAFPLSTTGFYNNLPSNETRVGQYELYGFTIDQGESDPNSMITYIDRNRNFTPAHMDYEKNEFNYGDWANAFFMKVSPCMLKYDGTVAYYLNPDDYSLKEDGQPSDIADAKFQGNAMVEFPKVYWKIVDNENNTANIYISNKQVDEDFHCWSHIDANGNEIDYCYMPIYNGSNQSNVLRSLSGKIPIYEEKPQAEVNYANANNKNNEHIWHTETFSDRQLVNLLLLLIGKSTNTQKVFGMGYCTGGTSESSLMITGTMNDKGLFWGKDTNIQDGVKVFGMEHWWGNQFRRIAGWINNKGVQKVKMTYGKSDGSTVSGYNFTGDGYIAISNATPSGSSGNGISSAVFVENGIIPKSANGSSSTYYTDALWFDNTKSTYAIVGGSSDQGVFAGALCANFKRDNQEAGWPIGASISCKPLA